MIVPLSGCSSPAISRKVVDLPHPDGPSSTSSEPSAASKLTPSTARAGPQLLTTSCSSIADIHYQPRPAARQGRCPADKQSGFGLLAARRLPAGVLGSRSPPSRHQNTTAFTRNRRRAPPCEPPV